MRFDGKVAIVTGASRGIGLGIAERLVREGAKVCITARKQEALDEAVASLGGRTRAIAVAGRSDEPEHQVDAIKRTLGTFGRIDVLVNNAGINPAYGPMIELEPGAARKIFEVNCLAALSWAQQAYRAWMREHGGSIVNMSSAAAVGTSRTIGFYGASKAMLSHITAELAVELAPGIRVNAVAPSVVKTKFAAALYEGREEQVAAAFPLQRLGVPDDIGSVVAFLASDDAAWLTGQVLVVDGGVTLTRAG